MAINIFLSYVYKDEALKDELVAHLSALRWQGVIADWYERNVGLGKEWLREIDPYLERADVILLLVSPDFVNSDYCYGAEVKYALHRHEIGQTCVIPIILRPIDLEDTPFAGLPVLPTDGKSVAAWFSPQEALLDVVRGVEAIARKSNLNPSLAHRLLGVPRRWALTR